MSDEHTTWRVTNYATRSDTGQALSWVRCSVRGQKGATVRLRSQDGAVTLSAEVGSRPEYGPYFCELGPVAAGRYTVAVAGLDVALNLWLDGTAPATVELAPAERTVGLPATKIAHAVLLGRMMAHRGNFLALTRYVAHFDAVVTFEQDEAAQAEHVILIGAPRLVSRQVEEQLRQAGVRVERAQGDIAAQLDRAVGAGVPFLSS